LTEASAVTVDFQEKAEDRSWADFVEGAIGAEGSVIEELQRLGFRLCQFNG
jgi:hypothetical protein